MWRFVDPVQTDVSDERIASISRVEKSATENPACQIDHNLLLVGGVRWVLGLMEVLELPAVPGS
jgi:hypothetical protein